jgi:glycosyltransferase involved in cell wall biosynthesis
MPDNTLFRVNLACFGFALFYSQDRRLGAILGDVPSVTVVLPVHNRQELIRRAIDSVLAQTMTDFELLVIDDCSTDATAEIVEKYFTDPRVRLVRNKTNLGPAGTRNHGIDLARGRYIAFQDSDDRWFPEKLSLQMKALQLNPHLQACFCGSLYYAREQCYYIPRTGTLISENAVKGDLSVDVLYSNPITPQALLVEKDLFHAIGGFDASLPINEDWELAIRMAQKTHFAFVDEPLVVIYRTANSVSSDRVADIAIRKQLLKKYATLFAEHPTLRARQNYLIAALSFRARDYRNAMQFFCCSFRDVPSFRCWLQIQRARLYSLFHR